MEEKEIKEGGKLMKKLTLIIIIILLGIFLLNTAKTVAVEMTLGSIFNWLNSNYGKLSSSELATLERRVGTSTIREATNLISEWGCLLEVSTAVQQILNER